MPSLQIRDLPADVYEALSYRAERERRSLAQQAIVELRKLPELVAAERRREAAASIRARNAGGAARRRPRRTPEAMIREDRER